PIDQWPQSLKTAVGLMLRSPLPIVQLWGEDGIMIYNDAYSVFAGGRHPQLLGSKVREGWPEVSDFNDNVMKVVLAGGVLSYEDQELTLVRRGTPEPGWMNLDYSPILDEEGRPAGVIAIVVETTAKVLAERWAAGERERLRRMFEQAPGFMAMLVGPDHVYDLANPAYMQLIGHRDVLGKTVREALPEVEGQGYFERLDHVFRTGEPYAGSALRVELQRSVYGQVEERFIDLVYQPVRSQDGTVIGIFSQGIDVTDRVIAEAALRASEAQFRTFAQAMPNHVWTASPDGRLDWFNDRIYEYSGATHARLAGGGWADVVHPDDLQRVVAQWRQAVGSVTTYEIEFRIRRADGVFRWHLVRAVPIRTATGEVSRWIGSNTDIEDQRRAAEALANQNLNLEQQVNERTIERDRMWKLSGDVMAVSDFQGRVVAVNPAWTLLLGWTEAELLGRSFLDMIHPDDHSATLNEMARLGQGERTFRFENRFLRKDGSYCLLSWTAVPDEHFIHSIGRDMTAEREAADVLRQTEVALQQAQKMETLGQLTGGVAHDFNNLLQVIGGNLQLLSKFVAGNEKAELRIASAMAGVSRGAKLASQLLAFGRRQPLEPKVVNIGRFISGLEDMLRRTLGETIDVETIISGGLWNSFVDPTQIENAVLNLAINARDAMNEHGKLTIEVGNAFLDEAYAIGHEDVVPGQYVVLAVSDTGTGMTPEVMERVFEPFFSTKPEGKGTGLGLSMVYGFVKQSGGHVKIYSEVGFGTTVKMYLPRALQGEEPVASAVTGRTTGGTETILVAEDDEEVRNTVVATLTDLGYRVLKAKDAQGALNIVESGAAINLLFTDVVMPGTLRSPELARRARERLPGLAVLFTSGYTENAIVHGGRLDAGVDLLGKPYSRESLARKIRQMLENQQQGGPPSAPRRGLFQSVPSSDPLGALTVLLVEDDALIRMNTAEILLDLGHTVEEAASAEAAMLLVASKRFDVIITDVGLPGASGTDFAQSAREKQPDVGVVFATGADYQVQDYAAGAVLLRKPYDSLGIIAALRAATPAG
ncbi:MAG TPA: PAS domain S-box protein, partial [Ancylobacter sp.]